MLNSYEKVAVLGGCEWIFLVGAAICVVLELGFVSDDNLWSKSSKSDTLPSLCRVCGEEYTITQSCKVNC